MLRMKKSIVVILGILLSLGPVVSSQIVEQETNSSDVGSFNAEIGLRDNEQPIIVLSGDFREIRDRQVLYGTVTHVRSDRTTRFQGLFARNHFVIQAGVRNQIINVIGRISLYDEETNEYHGNWFGFMVGQGRTNGWITISVQ
jgi:hypothetical protein